MIKSELIQRVLAQNPHLYFRDAEKVINAVLEEVVAALKRGDRVEVRGFGVFFVKQRSARMGRNPQSGVPVAVNQKNMPLFKAGKEIRERLNDAQAARSAHSSAMPD
jgi:integration host factor subunit beta